MKSCVTSPSMRREWIEMSSRIVSAFSLPSPSMRREWIEIQHSIPRTIISMSPSMRREWIEMQTMSPLVGKFRRVSLHAEGVD